MNIKKIIYAKLEKEGSTPSPSWTFCIGFLLLLYAKFKNRYCPEKTMVPYIK